MNSVLDGWDQGLYFLGQPGDAHRISIESSLISNSRLNGVYFDPNGGDSTLRVSQTSSIINESNGVHILDGLSIIELSNLSSNSKDGIQINSIKLLTLEKNLIQYNEDDGVEGIGAFDVKDGVKICNNGDDDVVADSGATFSGIDPICSTTDPDPLPSPDPLECRTNCTASDEVALASCVSTI